MLLSKKSKGVEDKNKSKGADAFKKSKKSKVLSPNKQKVTPDSKRMRKDQNANSNKNGLRPSVQNTQTIQSIKTRDKQAYKTNASKRYTNTQNKNKLLTTSPVIYDKRKSNQKQRSHDKSKSRSFSKSNTFRSNNQKDKSFMKSVTRKLYAHTKEVNRENSHSKSKSKSKSKLNYTGKDTTPQKQNKQTRPFNVADREIKFKKMEEQELKKAIKKKVQNRIKGEVFLYPQTERTAQDNNVEPSFKSKKKVPQIKTEFSERRGSFFDQNLLKRLEIGHYEQKKLDNCPFLHIKSSFQYKGQNKQHSISSRTEKKSSEKEEEEELKARQIQLFKKQEENKWRKMLYQLENLKKEDRIPEKIDQIIKELNENYSCLQSKVGIFFNQSQKDLKKSSKDVIKQTINHKEIHQVQDREFQHNKIEIQQQQEIIKEKNPSINVEKVPSEDKRQFKFSISQLVQQQNSKNQKDQSSQTKKLNTINLDNDFFEFVHKKSSDKLKKQLFESENRPKIDPAQHPENDDFDENKISDKNLLKQLDLLQKTSKLVEVISVNKSTKNEFQAQMEQIRQIQNQYFNNIPVNQDFSPNIDQQIKVHQDLSSQSMLLRSIQNFSTNPNPNAQSVASEIEHTLILEFCSNILKSKQILNNFLTTYSQLVDAKVINVDYGDDEFKPKVDSSNEFVMQMLQRLLNHFEVNEMQLFMKQINIPFQCKPIQILKFIRCVQEDLHSLSVSSNGENTIIMPFLGLEKIEEFQTEVLRNQYYIPNYFSFNHSIYDFFNDVFDELRPFGSKGKSIFSLQLSHGIKTFTEAKRLVKEKFQKTLSLRYYQEPIEQQKYSSQQGMFEIIYFTCLQVIDQIFERQAITIFKVLSRTSF